MAKKDEIWVTKDGTALNVSDMHEHHVRNTLRMLIRQLRAGDLKRLAYHHERLERAYFLGIGEHSVELDCEGGTGYETLEGEG